MTWPGNLSSIPTPNPLPARTEEGKSVASGGNKPGTAAAQGEQAKGPWQQPSAAMGDEGAGWGMNAVVSGWQG
ncbi:hypothetical protein [Acidocella sp.]|uniref:hypothetical protein n=1 Tax=Acidocella sp. TaxID=50710 RepID=UPI002611A001|nr:hypothetical protein [Acidocella sp.]MDD2796096.1 hypothetical protein [Acidocella sp.]